MARPAIDVLRPSEWVITAYFTYILILSQLRTLHSGIIFAPSVVSVCVIAWTVLTARAASGKPAWSVVRDWVTPLLVLLAYLVVDSLARPEPAHSFERSLLPWDRLLLHDWGLRAAIERFGALLPSVLEFSYLLLYAVPAMAIGILYVFRKRSRVDQFLFTFLLGTLLAYALLPGFPSESPRLAFPNQDLPSITTVFRRINIWILGSYDIRTSVFPSGHVAVGFSAAWGMLLAFPEKKAFGCGLAVFTLLVWANTFYARYHYAADGLASLIISLFACFISFQFYPRISRPTCGGPRERQ